MTPAGTQFGVRRPLLLDDPSFMGRKRVKRLLGYVLAASDTNCAIIVGPRFSGRSTLINQLSSSTLLRAFPTLPTPVVVHADFAGLGGNPDKAIERLKSGLARTLNENQLPDQGVRSAGDLVEAVALAHGVCPGRLLFAVDNFDAVGSDLRKDHQTEMRQAVYDRPRAAYIVASRFTSDRFLEAFGDELSEISPILQPVPNVLGPFNRPEIGSMLARSSGGALPRVAADRIADFVLQRVGGFPLYVQQALRQIEIEQSDSELPILDLPSDENSFDEILLDGLRADLARSFRYLSPSSQSMLRRGELPPNGKVADELLIAGWLSSSSSGAQRLAGTILERWIERYADETPLAAPQDADLYDLLLQAVESLNERYASVTGKRRERVVRPDVFTSASDSPYLRRIVRGADEFDRFVLALSKLLYDGTGGATSKKTLPDVCYSHPDCIVRQTMTLRNASVHLSHSDAATAQRNFDSRLAIYRRYLGTPDVGGRHGELARLLLGAAIRFVTRITEYCPFSSELSNEVFLEKVAVRRSCRG